MIALSLATLVAASGLVQAIPSNIQYHASNPASWKDKIKHVVVLVEENRSFDTFAGGLNYSSAIDGLLHHNYCNSMNASDPSEHADVCAGPYTQNVAADDPNHSISGVNMQL
jgi:phospholipase C